IAPTPPNASVSPHSFSLSGTGTVPTPAVSLSPTSLDFGVQPVGTTSAPQSVTLTNSGDGPLSISSISLSGANPVSFAIAGGGDSGDLAPGASRNISLTFSPPTAGSHSASLSLSTNAPGSPRSVA